MWTTEENEIKRLKIIENKSDVFLTRMYSDVLKDLLKFYKILLKIEIKCNCRSSLVLIFHGFSFFQFLAFQRAANFLQHIIFRLHFALKIRLLQLFGRYIKSSNLKKEFLHFELAPFGLVSFLKALHLRFPFFFFPLGGRVVNPGGG